MALTNEDLQAINSLLEPIRNQIKSIEFTLENETNRNIQMVNHLENELRKVKERINQIGLASGSDNKPTRLPSTR